MFFYAVGAILAPLISSHLIDSFGPISFFVFIAIGHILLATLGGIRMILGDNANVKTPYIYAPRTSFTIGRLTKAERDRQ